MSKIPTPPKTPIALRVMPNRQGDNGSEADPRNPEILNAWGLGVNQCLDALRLAVGSLLFPDAPAPTDPEPEVRLSDTATVDIDSTKGVNFYLAASANLAIGFPAGLRDGQKVRITIKSTGALTMTWATGYLFSGGASPPLTPNGLDTVQFCYRASTFQLEEQSRTLGLA